MLLFLYFRWISFYFIVYIAFMVWHTWKLGACLWSTVSFGRLQDSCFCCEVRGHQSWFLTLWQDSSVSAMPNYGYMIQYSLLVKVTQDISCFCSETTYILRIYTSFTVFHHSGISIPWITQAARNMTISQGWCRHTHTHTHTHTHISQGWCRQTHTHGWCRQIKSKSNQILFKVGNVHLKEKRKISKKVFTRLYSITNNNELYIWFKYFGTSLWNRTWSQMKIYFSEF